MFKPYKIHSLAKEMGLSSKEITTFLEDKDLDLAKKHMTVLDENYVNMVLEHFTIENALPEFGNYLAATKPEKPEVKTVKKEEKLLLDKTKGAAVAVAKKPEPQKFTPPQKRAEPSQILRPTGAGIKDGPAITQGVATGDKPQHVDTKSAQVNLDKYNERYEKIAKSTFRGNQHGGKQRFKGKGSGKGKRPMRGVETEKERLARIQLEIARKQQLRISIPEMITVGELAIKLKQTAAVVIKKLMELGIIAAINEVIDFDTAALVAMELGAKAEREVSVTIEERLFEEEDKEEDLKHRGPVVVVMGHVDHGKTSLLDAIRNASVTTGEAGGITQHIGAYRVNVDGQSITFLDTPGHAAFTSMRARGAQVTDIAILVVAADDGIMPQTIEAINHAKEAGVTIIVAINKMDKPSANPDKIMQALTEYELVPEAWGGDTICVPISAKTGEGIPELLEMIELSAEMLNLRANPDRLASGIVIEAKLDKGRGPVATILVQNGTLKIGDVLIAGTTVGRVRAMYNDQGEEVKEAGPSVPVEVIGLSEVPLGGDIVNAVSDEKLARELADRRRTEGKEAEFNKYKKVTLDSLFEHIAEGEMKELPIIVKADVAGSAEAVKQSLEKLGTEEVRVRVIHAAAGAINESDVMLADASGALVIGFNVRPDPMAEKAAELAKVDMHMYRVIYDAIDEVKAAMMGMHAPKYRDINIGRIEVRTTYKVSNIGTIAGCYVLDGHVERGAKIRVVREGVVLAEDEIKSLKRFKDDAKEVREGYECGIGLVNYNDIKEGDIFEAFITEEYRD